MQNNNKEKLDNSRESNWSFDEGNIYKRTLSQYSKGFRIKHDSAPKGRQ